jgi:hypothetical protein
MIQWIKPEQLWIVNLVLDLKPELRTALLGEIQNVFKGVSEVTRALGATEQPGQVPDQGRSLTNTQEGKITDWFASHPGKHPLSAVRTDLGVEPTSKPFKTAIQNLVQSGAVKFNNKRGKGAEYWSGK